MDQRTAALVRQAWPRQIAFLVFLLVVLFGPAGTLAYWQAWLFLAVFIGCSVGLGLYFVRTDPALIERRMQAGPGAEREPAQRIIIALLLAGLLAMLVVSALDRRWLWSDVPAWLTIVADLGIVGSFVIFFYVMKQNSYAAATVRVEGAQTVISTGLYGVVRHPMYAGTLPLMIAMPLALGSYWALLLVIPLLPVLAWRLLDEERVLRRDLPGYAAYCARVRWRLVPGIW
ncbi:MAG TPA: isoprenylcysteine carboxylmethyltransferase family protein [Pseudolabrys sp.]|nr:isoprenylcysteine carboxylmethyltransferase family protein [Pseudolabrys sp.]